MCVCAPRMYLLISYFLVNPKASFQKKVLFPLCTFPPKFRKKVVYDLKAQLERFENHKRIHVWHQPEVDFSPLLEKQCFYQNTHGTSQEQNLLVINLLPILNWLRN